MYETEDLGVPNNKKLNQSVMRPMSRHYAPPPSAKIKSKKGKKVKVVKKRKPKKKIPKVEDYGNDLYDFQSEYSETADFEEIIPKKPAKKKVAEMTYSEEESSEVRSAIEFYDSLEVDYGTAHRDDELIRRVRRLFNSIHIDKATKILSKSVNVRSNTSIQTILEHIDDVIPWVGHVYDGAKYVGQIDTYDVTKFLLSIFPKTSPSNESLMIAAAEIKSRTASDIIKSELQLFFGKIHL